MKAQILQENLSKSLNTAVRFVSNRAQLPILSNVLLKAAKTNIYIMATNLEMSSSISLGAKVGEDGDITVPAKTLFEIVSNIRQGTIDLVAEKEQLVITSGSFKSTILGINSSDFPAIPQKIGAKSVAFEAKKFVELVESVIFSCSADETRPTLTGVLFVFGDNSLEAVASDGFRLSRKKISLPSPSGTAKQTLILPKSILAEVVRLAKDAQKIKLSYSSSDNQVIFEVGECVFSSRVIEGTFPDFEKIIPKSSQITLNVDKEEFARAIKLASVFARDAANIVKFTVTSGSLGIAAESAKSGKQNTEVDAKVDGFGEELTISFNYRFVEEYLNAIGGEEVKIELTAYDKPAVFRDPTQSDYLHLIMPVKVQG